MSKNGNGTQVANQEVNTAAAPEPAQNTTVPATTPQPTIVIPKPTLEQKRLMWCVKHPKAAKAAKYVWNGLKVGGAAVAGYLIGRKTAKPMRITVTPITSDPQAAQEEPAEDTED